MVDMQLSNKKLIKRAEDILISELNIDHKTAEELLKKHGNVRRSIENFNNQNE